MTRRGRSDGPEIQVERHAPPLRTVSSIGSEPSQWIGPGLHSHQPTPDARKVSGDQPLGYLGPTSYSAIFSENKLGSTVEDFAHGTTNTIFQEYDIAKPSDPEPCNLEAQEHIDQGVRVLQRFPNKGLCERLIDRYFEVGEVILPEQVVFQVHKSIWSTYGECLSRPKGKDDEKLCVMSKGLCKIAMTPLGPSSSTKEWMESFSDEKLRWEIVGNFYAMFGIAVMSMSDWDPLFVTADNNNPYNKRQYGGEMRECAEACLALCNDVDAVNDFVVCLMSAIFILQSFHEGDASKIFRAGLRLVGVLKNVRSTALEKTWNFSQV